MRILHCITSLRRGGAEKTLIRLINNSNFKHVILTIFDSSPLINELKTNVLIISIFPLTLKNQLRNYREILNFSPDLIQGWMYHGDFLATILGFLFKRPVYWNIRHGKMSFKHSSKKTIILRSMLSLLSYLSPKKIISCSYCGLRVHSSIGYKKSLINVIHNGYESIEENLNTSQLTNETPLRFGSVGRDSPQKRRKYYIKIIHEISKIRAIQSASIIGRDIPCSSEIVNLASNSKIFDLQEEKTSTKSIFESFNILIITSNYGEGCPNVLIEALLRNLVCFSTDVGDAKYLINDNDFIISDTNHYEAAEKIINTLSKPDLNEKVLNINKRLKQLTDIKLMVNKYHFIWSKHN